MIKELLKYRNFFSLVKTDRQRVTVKERVWNVGSRWAVTTSAVLQYCSADADASSATVPAAGARLNMLAVPIQLFSMCFCSASNICLPRQTQELHSRAFTIHSIETLPWCNCWNWHYKAKWKFIIFSHYLRTSLKKHTKKWMIMLVGESSFISEGDFKWIRIMWALI